MIVIINVLNISYQMNLNSQRELDWLQFSRFSSSGPQSLLAFQSILQGRTISQQMFQRLPKGYLSKLLKTFRNQLLSHDRNSSLIDEILVVKTEERQQLVRKAQILEATLAESKAKLNSQHQELKVKSEVLKVLMAKIKKKEKAVKPEKEKQLPQTNYYCPFCKIDTFKQRQSFESHVMQMHSPTTEAPNLQNFILQLKDKELAMMEMVMKKNEDLNEAHRTLLEREMKVRTKHFKEGLTGEREVQQDVELMGESEYIWFKKENQSDNIPKNHTQPFQPTIMMNQPPLITQVPYQYFTAANPKPSWQPKSSPSPQPTPLSFLQPPTSKPLLNSSIYKSQPSILEGFIYNSGPLLDDQSDSQLMDYFPGGTTAGTNTADVQTQRKKLIVDEQIVLDDKLLSKWGSSILCEEKSHVSQQRSQEKLRLPSELLSVDEESVLDRDFSLSKDSSDINLSDLRYSKLAKRQQERTERDVGSTGNAINDEKQPVKAETTRPKKLETVLFTVPESNELMATKQSDLLKEFFSGAPQLPKIENTQKQAMNSSKDFSKKASASSNILEEFFIQPSTSVQPNCKPRSSFKTQKPSSCQPSPTAPKKYRRTQQPNPNPAPQPASLPTQLPAPSSLPPDPPEPSTDRHLLTQLQDLTLIKQQEIQQTLITDN